MNVRTLPLEQAETGMRLAVDIQDSHGAVLLAAGAKLTDELRAALRRRGIEQVSVVEEAALTAAERGARNAEIRARLDHLFRRFGETEANRMLHAALLEYRLEQPD
jgi:transposase